MTIKIKASNIETGAVTADKIASGAGNGGSGLVIIRYAM